MATIDLGKIKMVWRGAYNNATAYTPDDVVSSGGSSYICILASTGNAVTNTTYWNVLAQGGTDVGTTLTTQGDLLYRDGSGLQRLAKPGSTMFLQMTSGGVPSWSAVSSDFVKITSGTFSSSADNLVIDGFTNSIYKGYVLKGQCVSTGNSGNTMRFVFRDGSGDLTAEYLRCGDYRAITSANNVSGSFNNASSYNQNHFPIVHHGSTSEDVSSFEVVMNDLTSTTYYKTIMSRGIGRDGSQWVFWNIGGMYRPNNNAVTGIKLYTGSGSNYTSGNYEMYGFK